MVLDPNKKRWVAYDNGAYEPLDPTGDIRRKKREPGMPDWWVEEKDASWIPSTFADTKRGRGAKQEYTFVRPEPEKTKTQAAHVDGRYASSAVGTGTGTGGRGESILSGWDPDRP